MKYVVDENTKLLDFFKGEGFRFPCGGKSLCGRCRIIAKDIEPTEKDKLFFSKEELEQGYRIACDKTTCQKVSIEPLMEKAVATRKPVNPGVFVILDKDSLDLYFLSDGKIIDSYSEKNPSLTRIDLQGTIGFNAIEMYEEYGIALVETIMLLGEYDAIKAIENAGVETAMQGTIEAHLFSLPCHDLYIPPFSGGKINHVPLAALEMDFDTLAICKGYLLVKKDDLDVYEIVDGRISHGGKRYALDPEELGKLFGIAKDKMCADADLPGFAPFAPSYELRAAAVYSVFRQRKRYEYLLEQSKYHAFE